MHRYGKHLNNWTTSDSSNNCYLKYQTPNSEEPPKKEEYDIWAMEMEHYLEYIDNEVWKLSAEISSVERKEAKNILLMAFPKNIREGFMEWICKSDFGKPSELVLASFYSSTNFSEKEVLARFADEVIYSIFAKQSGGGVQVDGKTHVGFDKRKLECFNCHNTGHFARECTAKGTHDGKKKRDSFAINDQNTNVTFNAVMGSWGSAVKTSASYNWRNTRPNFNYNSRPTFVRTEHPLKNMVDRGIFDSGCSGHMTGNKDQLEDFEEFNGGSVTFGGFAEIVDFLRGSNLRYALTSNPTIYDSLVKQFWQTATTNTKADGTLEINATIDTIGYTITEASIRDTLQLEDATGITMLPNDEIFEGMGQMGYPTDGTFTFWKSFFTPQWRYLVHHLLHCISSKSGGWDQFGSNIATALICLSTDRVYNFSKLIFDGMVANLKSKTKFLIIILASIPSPTPIPAPIPSPTPIPASIPTPTPIPETEPAPFEHTFEEPSHVHQHFSPPQEQAQGQMPMDDLLQLVKKVKKLEGFLNTETELTLLQQKVASLKPKSIDKGRRYKRRKDTKGKKVVSSLDFQEEVDTDVEQVNTVEGINTGSIKLSTVSEQVSTGSEQVSTVSAKRIDQGVGSTSGIRACALRNFDLGKMELENSQNNSLAKLPILKLGEYEMWEIRIKQYFQIQDYALWEVIENGNSWVPIPVTAPESGPSTALKMTVPSTTEEKICKKNDVKARSLLLMALPNEHQLTFNQYADAQSMFIAIKARFGGNDATKKTQKALLKQQYENFNATSSESLDSIFNRLQKLVSRLAILGVDTPAEDLNVKFLRSLPSEWDTHVVVWMNKPDFETMGLDDLYNNFKIVEQKVKRTVAANNDDKNLAFLTTSSPSSTNTVNTANTGVSTGNTKVNTASTETSTASFSDATVEYGIVVHESKEVYQKNWKEDKIVEFQEQETELDQGNSSKAVRIEDAAEKAMFGFDGGGFDWSDLQRMKFKPTMALMAFSDTEVDKEWKEKLFHPANNVRLEEPKQARENLDAPIIEDWVSDDEEEVESTPKVEKKIPTVTKIESVNTVNKLKNIPVSTARFVNTVQGLIYAHPNTNMFLVLGKRSFQNQAQRPFYKNTALTKRSNIQNINTARQAVNTVRPKVNTVRAKGFNASNSQLNEKGFVDSGCSRHMSGNIAHLSDFKEFDGGYVTFGGGANGGRITGKGKQHRASCKTKAFSPSTKPLFMLHMDLFGPTFVSSLMHKKYCLVVTDDFSRFSWVFFLRTKDETSEILKNFIKEIENLVDKKVKIIRSDNGTEFKNHVMDEFCREKGIKREYSVARTPQQNGVAERKNRTLIEAARTMLADSKLPTTFWAEAVSTACYVQNRVLVVKPQNKTPYELFRGIKPAIGFMKPFGCHVTILNTLDKLGKFDGKSDEGFFVGYSLSSKAFRVYNIRTRKVQENLHVGFLENKPMVEGNGPKWLFDLDSLTNSMNYVPIVAGTFSNVSAGIQEGESSISSQQDQDCIFMPIWKDASYFEDSSLQSDDGIDDHQVNTAVHKLYGSRELSTAAPEVNTATSEGLMGPIPTTEDTQEEDQGFDLGNLSPSYAVSSTPHTRIHKDHPIDHVIGDVQSSVQTRRMTTSYSELGFLSAIYEGKTHQDLHTCLFACFLSQEEPKRISKALSDPAWVEAMQEELLQFKLQNVWVLVDLPKGHRAIGTKWVYRNKKDERGIVVRNKARLVAQGHTQEEGIDYDEVFAPVARIEAIRIFLSYVLFGFHCYQRMSKVVSYMVIEEEVYVCQPPGIEDTAILLSLHKVVKGSIWTHQAPELDVKSASTLTDLERPLVKDSDADDVDEHLYRSMIGSLMYLTASRPDIMFAVCACARFQVSPKTSHLLAVKRIFRYLKGKPSLGLWYSKDSPLELVAYTDSDYAGATLDRKSTMEVQFL
ncbi:putative ribonuclease H-like domain-containing protein [Tanacetum coccineum]